MIPIGLSDELVFIPSGAPDVELEVEGAPELAGKPDNLVLKAARAMKNALGLPAAGARIILRKNIPTGAGMGGGSSDAATTLQGLKRLWQADINEGKLYDLAAGLGMDVPFFLLEGAALASGRGENLTRIRSKDLWLVTAMPRQVSVSTAWAYGNAVNYDAKTPQGVLVEMLEALDSGDVEALGGRLYNGFACGVEKHFPAVRELRELMKKAGAHATMMTGSGAAVFGLCPDAATAQMVGLQLTNAGYWNWSGKSGINNES
jgi:4-diphosphocytidyl-2-C-methyl-D-erythritol kinase